MTVEERPKLSENAIFEKMQERNQALQNYQVLQVEEFLHEYYKLSREVYEMQQAWKFQQYVGGKTSKLKNLTVDSVVKQTGLSKAELVLAIEMEVIPAEYNEQAEETYLSMHDVVTYFKWKWKL